MPTAPTAGTPTPPTPDLSDALDLLSGDAQAFLRTAWASRSHVHKADAQSLVGLLSLDDVDGLLTSTALRTPALRIAKDGSVLPTSSYTRSATIAGTALTGLVDPRKVVELFSGGATLVLQGLHRYWPPLTALVRDLELQLGHSCQANAYLTPPGSQGFARHEDSHDVFVFQTFGAKSWEVSDGGEELEVLMEPGTSMYLPAGTPHAARTQQTASLHVTVGINTTPWRSLLTRLVTDVLADPAYDERLPAGYPLSPGELAAPLAERLRHLVDALDSADAEVVAGQEAARFLSSRPAMLRGAVADVLHVEAIDDDTTLVRRQGAVCVLAEELTEDGRLRLLLGDREMLLPAWLAEPVLHLAGSSQLRPRDLARWLDPQSRLVLTRRLVREGLLRVAA